MFFFFLSTDPSPSRSRDQVSGSQTIENHNRMIALERFKNCSIRPGFFFGLGAHLGVSGLLIMVMYYMVSTISMQDARELLSWVVPTAQGCCLLGALSLFAGLSARDSEPPRRGHKSCYGWIIRKIMPFGAGHSWGADPVRKRARRPSSADVQRTVSLLKSLDWKVFRNLGVAYFREVGFRVVDQPGRANGVDFLLYLENDYSAVAVRCLPWGVERVELKQVRDFHRTMLLAGASQGVMLTTGAFEEEALELGEGSDLELLGGDAFVTRLLSLPPETSRGLLEEAAGAEKIREEGKEEMTRKRKGL